MSMQKREARFDNYEVEVQLSVQAGGLCYYLLPCASESCPASDDRMQGDSIVLVHLHPNLHLHLHPNLNLHVFTPFRHSWLA